MTPDEIDALTRAIIDRGGVLDASWQAFRAVALHPIWDKRHLDDARMAFFAGAQYLHVFMSAAVNPDVLEPTPDEDRRIGIIQGELSRFDIDFRAHIEAMRAGTVLAEPISGEQLTAEIIAAITPLVDRRDAGLVIEALAAAFMGALALVTDPDGRRTILRRYINRLMRTESVAAEAERNRQTTTH